MQDHYQLINILRQNIRVFININKIDGSAHLWCFLNYYFHPLYIPSKCRATLYEFQDFTTLYKSMRHIPNCQSSNFDMIQG